MPVTLEQVDRLRARADVTYEEARSLLEDCGGDLLEALITLERLGRTHPGYGGVYSTRPGIPPPPPGPQTRSARREPEENHRAERTRTGHPKTEGLSAQLRHVLQTVFHTLRPSSRNCLELRQGGRILLSMPVLLPLLALLCAPWAVLPLLLVGLLFGIRLHFSGPELDRDSLNGAMDGLSDAADGLRATVQREVRRRTAPPPPEPDQKPEPPEQGPEKTPQPEPDASRQAQAEHTAEEVSSLMDDLEEKLRQDFGPDQ